MNARRSSLARRRREAELLRVLAIVVLSGFVLVEAVAFVTRISYTATITVGGLFIALLVFPLVRLLNTWLPLWAALGLVCVGVLLALAGILYGIVPAALDQLTSLIHDLPYLQHRAERILNDPSSPIAQRLPDVVRGPLQQLPAVAASYLQRESVPLSLGAVALLRSAAGTAALVVAIPVMAIYMLAEGALVKRTLLSYLPEDRQAPAVALLAELAHVVGGWVRGQLLVAATIGTLIAIVLWALGVPYALLIGASAGVLDFIPYIGPFAGYVPAAIVAMIDNGPLEVLYVTLGFIAVNQLEGHLIGPRIVSGSVGLTPLAVIFALLIGGELFGLRGLMIAVPLAGVLRVLLAALRPAHHVARAAVQPGLTQAPRASAPEIAKSG